MELHFVPPDLRKLDEASAELLVCSIWEDERPFRGLAGLLDWRLSGRLSRLARQGFLRGESGEVTLLAGRPHLAFDKLLLFGLGPHRAFGEETFRSVIHQLLRALEGLNVRRAIIELPGRGDDTVTPLRAAELALECLGAVHEHDAWWLVENSAAERVMVQRAQEEQLRVRRT